MPPCNMVNEETIEKVKSIKRSFRLRMNGDASRSMREKGVNYKLNWGISLPELKQMAKDYGKDYTLAVELWKEPIRECKILATLIMPDDQMSPELVDVWMEQATTQELAEMLAHNLLQHLDFAPALAFEWIAGERFLWQLAGYNVLASLFSKGMEPNERGINEFVDQAQATLGEENTTLKRAAYNCILRFCDLGEEYEQLAAKAFPSIV